MLAVCACSNANRLFRCPRNKVPRHIPIFKLNEGKRLVLLTTHELRCVKVTAAQMGHGTFKFVRYYVVEDNVQIFLFLSI